MEEDIKILEEFAHDLMQDYIYSKDEIPKSDIRLRDAIQNLIARYKELERKLTPTPDNAVPLEYQTMMYVDKRGYVSKEKIKEILDKYKHTEIGDTDKIIEFYKKIQELLEES